MQNKFFLEKTRDGTSGKNTLDRIQERIRRGKLKKHYCKDLARELISYLCGEHIRFEKKTEQYPNLYFIQHVMQEMIMSKNNDNNLFLLQIGKDYHTLVIEKLLKGEEVRFIIYQSWYSTFTLDWWLGNDRAPHQISEEQLLLREAYGKGKELTINDLKNYILMLTPSKEMSSSKRVGIAGFYKINEYIFESSKLQFS